MTNEAKVAESKVFKSYNAARKYAVLKCGPQAVIVKVKRLYIVLPVASTIDEIALMTTQGEYAATVGLGHFARLGNANHAKESADWYGKYAFKKIEGTIVGSRLERLPKAAV
jgi:hypothetical protein